MAKARTTDSIAQNGQISASQTANAGTTAISVAEARRAVQIEIPLTSQPLPTEFVFHVDCKLTPQQSTVARRIAQQLDLQNACLENGQRIVNVHGALKWLLEQIAKQL
jgi:hypothetical protein